MEIELGPGGRLLKPGFHDGYVLGMELTAKDRAVIKITKVSGERYSLSLSGVERFLCNDFAEGNIVSEIFVMSGIPIPLANLHTIIGPPHPSAAKEYHARHELVLQQKASLVEQGKLTFLAIVPSYGCELNALCKSVEVVPELT